MSEERRVPGVAAGGARLFAEALDGEGEGCAVMVGVAGAEDEAG
eukprot:CAMPEP_0198659584 /NCGR_PEP_ID=MMETSP1467-20131203/32655_1 /TAXON_ID=1462469 /ORGANISM="unid. sp., Strain CCMP2135" /LENGTH=43 /DNA_ID= /DNA_START= /DNA_END= /DNA_ORIENTATION=